MSYNTKLEGMIDAAVTRWQNSEKSIRYLGITWAEYLRS